jgi:hypothetical protein
MKDISTPTAIVLGICIFVVILGILVTKYYFDKKEL